MRTSIRLRRKFIRELFRGIGIIWPAVSVLLVVIALLGLFVAHLEGWSMGDGLYFSFVTGLTIGYGDLVPKHTLARFLAIMIGTNGILVTGLIVAIGVSALQRAVHDKEAN